MTISQSARDALAVAMKPPEDCPNVMSHALAAIQSAIDLEMTATRVVLRQTIDVANTDLLKIQSYAKDGKWYLIDTAATEARGRLHDADMVHLQRSVK